MKVGKGRIDEVMRRSEENRDEVVEVVGGRDYGVLPLPRDPR